METSLWEAEVSLPGVWHREVNQLALYLLLRTLHRDLPTWPSARDCLALDVGLHSPTGACIFVLFNLFICTAFSVFIPRLMFTSSRSKT